MTTELTCLVGMTGFFLLAWLPGSMAKSQTWGRRYVVSNRDETGLTALPQWGQRANRAYENLKSYYPGFIVAILALQMLGKHDRGIEIAAIVYVVARLGHFFVYIAGQVLARSSFWFIALMANFYLLARVCC